MLSKFGSKSAQKICNFLLQSEFRKKSINEMPILKLFVKKFKEEFNPIFYRMRDDSIDIASLIGLAFYEKNPTVQVPSINRKLVLKQFQLSEILELSQREKEVLFSISKGLSAGQIACDLQLSQRTVEHYIENIKNKLNCFSKAELIQKANEFLSIGYSLP